MAEVQHTTCHGDNGGEERDQQGVHRPLAVQATNDVSLVSKQSAVVRGYLTDPWLQPFAIRPVDHTL